ncbi:MAG: hypothetical protein C5B43_01995 [Verrucomicrobia bacterium]|nr:MAG: hypothetical protein C5B43_01995 [Verrucomicrobiota bacterium]
MSKRSLESTVLVLNKEKSGENFLKFELFCPNNGKIISLNRLSSKSPNSFLDLFDISTIHLTFPQLGAFAFIKDFHTLFHHQNISKNYNSFYYASLWMKILSLNLEHIDNLKNLFSLTQKALNAFNLSLKPQSIYLKTLYLFIRSEGYPIKEDWLPNLPQNLLTEAISILKNPLTLQETSDTVSEELIQNLYFWIKQKTDIISIPISK